MPVPSFDINNHILNYLPRRKRKPKWIGWLKGVLSALDRLNKLFNDFRGGSTDLGYWSNAVTYGSGDRVRTLFGVFESLSSGNIGNNPITDDGTYWFKVLEDFVGANERISWTVQKLNFEKALNTRFQGVLTDNGFTGFKQPNAINPGIGYTPLSDIFIEYYVPDFTSFVVFETETDSSVVYQNNSADNVVFDGETYTSTTTYRAKINIPAAVFSALGTTDVATSIVMNFVDKIKRIGTTYVIVTY